ncbi:MAG: hypothetical protein ABSB89_11020 [Candidatus Bathyarchaeia archaeon]|jgi:hypothetical protein
MTENDKVTTFSLYSSDAEIIRKFFGRTHTDMTQVFHELAVELQKADNDLDSGKLLYLWSWDVLHGMVHLYIGKAPRVCNISDLCPTAQKFYRAQKEKEDAELKGEKS